MFLSCKDTEGIQREIRIPVTLLSNLGIDPFPNLVAAEKECRDYCSQEATLFILEFFKFLV